MSSKRSIANSVFTMDERNDARHSIAKAEAELQRIATDIAKLQERQEEVTNNLSQLKKSLVIHRILPGEIIGRIFSFLRTERISLPYKLHMTPPQITVSHVCSKWREIALAIPTLWNDVQIVRDIDKWVQVAKELHFNRASMQGINIALNMDEVCWEELENTFYNIILPLRVKKLHLSVCLSWLERLLQNSDDIIANIDEITLDIQSYNFTEVSNPPQFFSKVRSLISRQDSFVGNQFLPWTQMRCLDTSDIRLSVSTVLDVLRQSPLLEVCKIRLDDEAAFVSTEEPIVTLELPQLRIFHLFRDHNSSRRSLDAFLRSVKYPNITDLILEINHWTRDTYSIIQNHYNLKQLLKLSLTAGYPYPVSKVLLDAPALQELVIVCRFFFMDTSALHGISSGTLGRCLTSLDLRGRFDVRGVLDMMIARQRRVKEIVEVGRGWQDQISAIKRISVLNEDQNSYGEEVMDQIGELKKLGIDVYHSDS